MIIIMMTMVMMMMMIRRRTPVVVIHEPVQVRHREKLGISTREIDSRNPQARSPSFTMTTYLSQNLFVVYTPKKWFLAVQDSSIGDLVTHSLTHSVSESETFDFRAEQSRAVTLQ